MMTVMMREKRIRNSLLQKLVFPHCLFDKIIPIEDMETIIEIAYQNSIQYSRNARRDYEIFTLYFKDKVSIEVLMDKFKLSKSTIFKILHKYRKDIKELSSMGNIHYQCDIDEGGCHSE